MSNILDHHLNNNNNTDDDADDIVISTKSNVLLKNSSISINNNNNDADVDDDDRNQFTINESSLLNNNNLKLNDQQVLYNNHISTSKSFPVIQNDYVHSFNDTIDCSSSFNPSTTTSIITNIYDGNDRLTTKSSSTTTIPLINLTNESFIQLFFPNFAQQISTTIMSGLNWINQINAATLFQNICNHILYLLIDLLFIKFIIFLFCFSFHSYPEIKRLSFIPQSVHYWIYIVVGYLLFINNNK